MSWLNRTMTLASTAAKRRAKPVNTIPRPAVPRRAPIVIETQQSGSTRSSILQEILGQNQSSGSKITFGAAILLGATMLVTLLKEGSPARVIMTSTEALIRQRKTQRAPAMLMNWLKASYVYRHLEAFKVLKSTRVPSSWTMMIASLTSLCIILKDVFGKPAIHHDRRWCFDCHSVPQDRFRWVGRDNLRIAVTVSGNVVVAAWPIMYMNYNVFHCGTLAVFFLFEPKRSAEVRKSSTLTSRLHNSLQHGFRYCAFWRSFSCWPQFKRTTPYTPHQAPKDGTASTVSGFELDTIDDDQDFETASTVSEYTPESS
ncbi:hypothetical protein KCU83_g511, partial [Aureobasidium melanogenum]